MTPHELKLRLIDEVYAEKGAQGIAYLIEGMKLDWICYKCLDEA